MTYAENIAAIHLRRRRRPRAAAAYTEQLWWRHDEGCAPRELGELPREVEAAVNCRSTR